MEAKKPVLKFLGCTITTWEKTDIPQHTTYKVGDIVLFREPWEGRPCLGKITKLEFYKDDPDMPLGLKESIEIIRLTKKLKEWRLGDPCYYMTNLDIIQNFGQ